MSKTAPRPLSALSECPESCRAVRESAKPMVMKEKRHMNVMSSSVMMRCSTMMRMPRGLYTLTARRDGKWWGGDGKWWNGMGSGGVGWDGMGRDGVEKKGYGLGGMG